MTLVLRIPKGSKLTKEEMDGNLTYLEGLGEGKVTTTAFNAFTASYTTGSFTGSYKGDGSGLTGIPGVTPIDTSSFATTSSNVFVGNQIVTGSVTVTGAITGSQVGNIIPFYFDNQAAFPSAATYHGAIAHSHSEGKMYYAHGGVWIELANTTGSFTGSFVGDGSGLTGIPGVTPIATGSFATTGSNTFIGDQVVSGSFGVNGLISQTGLSNFSTIIGTGAGNPTGITNTLIGFQAGRDLGTGFRNTYVGTGAGAATTGGDSNTFIGQSAGGNNVSGSSNIIIGRSAGNTLADGTTPVTTLGESIFIGNFTKSGNDNIFNQIVIGTNAVGEGENTVTIGNNNIVSTHLKGTVFGSTFTGSFVGSSIAATSLTVSGSISQVGIGEANTIIGDRAGLLNNPSVGSGDYNTFIGVDAAAANVFGRGNTVIGPNALYNNSNGDSNIAIGSGAGSETEGWGENLISNESIYIGNGSQAKSNNQTNQIVIGNFVTGNGSNTVTIGDNNIVSTHLKGTILGDASYTTSGRWTVGNNESIDYTFTGVGFTSITNDPILYLARGRVYEFVITSGGSHPFQIRVSNGGAAYNDGITNNGAISGVVRFEVPFNAPNTLYYQCTNHSGMGNVINVYPSI